MAAFSIDTMSREALLAALEWQLDIGADEAIGDAAVNRYDAPQGVRLRTLKFGAASNIAPVENMPSVVSAGLAAPEVSRLMAAQSGTLAELKNAMGVFDLCALKEGARTLVFADGSPGADVMIIGEAPGRDEDIQGKPFVGRAGQLLDKMFAAIGLSRTSKGKSALYITNVIPWRPPQNRDPDAEEIAMMLPFLERHIALAQPKLLVLMGNTSCKAVLGRSGITRMRGHWETAFDRPALPMFHPAALLRDPLKKRNAWSDLQSIRDRLERL
ncbi:MAG: uracil-DNA glycosylase [Pseudomonadota bacterium]